MSDDAVKPKVLLADDEALLRLVAVEFLEDAGFNVVEAADGEMALDILKRDTDISLLVSDIRMPRMNGYQLVEESLSIRPHLKVMLMTGYAQEPVPAHIANRGIKIIYKPFDAGKFVETAKGMIG